MTIFTQFDADTGWYEIMCDDGKMRPMPAGPRLFRAPPLPDVKFQHETKAGADVDAGKIRVYLDGLKPRKISKKEMREFAA